VFFNHLIEEHTNAMSETPKKIHFQLADLQRVFGTCAGWSIWPSGNLGQSVAAIVGPTAAGFQPAAGVIALTPGAMAKLAGLYSIDREPDAIRARQRSRREDDHAQ
jgi:hypothetical protein